MAHLDLDDFRPEPHSFTFRGVEYRIPGQIPVPTVLRAVQLEQQMRLAEDREQKAAENLRTVLETRDETTDEGKAAIAEYQEAADDPAWEAAITETYEIVMELLRDENEAVPELRLSAQECSAILAMVKSGRAPSKTSVQEGRALAESVAEEVGVDIGGQEPPEGSEGASGPPTAPPGASRRRSRSTAATVSGSGPRTRSRKSSSE